MEIELWQAFLIGLIYYLGTVGTPWLTLLGSISVLYKPLVAGTLVGLVLGDPVTGCIIGATINLPYLAFISAGGTVPVDPGLAGSLGTALAMAAQVEPSVAVSLAVPLGLLGTMIWVAHMTIDVFFVHMADKAAEEGNIDKICFYHVIPPQIVMFLITVIPVMLGAYFGADVVKSIISLLEGKPLHILSVIGGILPALGIAMNLRAIGKKGTIVFFLLGFLMSVYFKLDVLTVALFAGIIAYIYTLLSVSEGGVQNGTGTI